MLRTGTLVLAGLVLLGCQPKPETAEQMKTRMDTESAAAQTAIEAKNALFMRWVAEQKPDSIATLYAASGRIMAPNMAVVSGPEGVAGFMKGMYAPNTTVALTLTADEVTANGPLAIERGHWTYTITPVAGAPTGTMAVSDSGSYLVHWHQIDGDWKLVDDIWNSVNPPMKM